VAYLIYCEDDVSVTVPDEIGAEHRHYIDSRRHLIRAGGPIVADDGATVLGRVMFTVFETRKEAEDFIFNEPFFKLGRVRNHMIQPMLIRIPA
jgi:hypothetical protein